MRRRRILAFVKAPSRRDMEETVDKAIGAASTILWRSGADAFYNRLMPQLSKELLEIIEAYAWKTAADDKKWRTDDPVDCGYYLGAWKSGRGWVISELWYNPESTGNGWWKSRMYFHQQDQGDNMIEVAAWLPMPKFRPPRH